MVKQGSRWSTNDRKTFRVIEVVIIEGHVWIHYINEQTGNEYSCYRESFESRFTEILE